MTDLLEDLVGIENPSDRIFNTDGTINLTEAQQSGQDLLNIGQTLFPDRTVGVHIGNATAGLVERQGLGIEVGVGIEVTYGVGISYGRGVFNRNELEFDVTASGAIIGGVGVARPEFPSIAAVENERVGEVSFFFGEIEDLEGASVSLEFGITINGLTVGAGATVPADEVSKVVNDIEDHLLGVNFHSQNDREHLFSTLSDILPPGSMLTIKGGTVVGGGTGVAVGAEINYTALGLTTTEAFQQMRSQLVAAFNQCFVSGTSILLSDGSFRAIQDVLVGDVVQSYDNSGGLVPGRVVRTFSKDVTHVLDFFGTGMTPGHVTLCGDGKFAGQHVPIMDIIRSDGAIVQANGTLVRAATGCIVGSEGDTFVTAIVGDQLEDGRFEVQSSGRIRLGTRIFDQHGTDISVIELIQQNNGSITDDGLVISHGSDRPMPLVWTFGPALPNSEDYVLQRSGMSLADIYDANEWEAAGPRLSYPELDQAFSN